jgi:hypothetical protein
MSNGFDVYHKWLSIPPSDQPPNHYRLLGMGLFESDPDVISSAADRQMAHVQTYKNGPHSVQSQKLLNEIAAAKLCLLKPAKREIYDAELRRRLAAKEPMLTTSSAPLASATATLAASAGARPSPMPPPPIAAPPQLDEFSDGETQRPLFGTAAVLTAGSVLILLLIIAIVAILRSGQSSPTSSANDPAARTADNVDNAASNGNATAKTGDSSALPSPVPTETSLTSKIPSLKPDPTEKPPVSPPIVPANPNIDVKTSDPLKKPDKNSADPTVKPTTDPASIMPPAPDPAAPRKLLVPDGTAEAAAEIRFAETFAAATPQAILDKSQTLSDGPLVYVALRKALDMALNSGDVALVGRIVDELSRRFTIETVPLRAKAYNDLRQHVATTPGWEALAEAALALVDEAVAANHADLALPLAETSLVAARKSGNLELVRKVTLRVLLLQDQGSGARGRGSGTQTPTGTPARGPAGS